MSFRNCAMGIALGAALMLWAFGQTARCEDVSHSQQSQQVTAKPTVAPTTRSLGPGGVHRPAMTEEEYTKLAKELREKYSRPSNEWPKATIDEGVKYLELERLRDVPVPADNPISKQKQELGEKLFFDPRLSGSGQIACASCHDPDLAWADGRTTAFGHERSVLKRNSPSIAFSAFNKAMFWDGRAGSLEQQMAFPVTSHDEMNGDPKVIVERLSKCAEYRQDFHDVFGTDTITFENAAKAVATFERYIASLGGRSKFDKFLGGQTNALSDEALRGLHLFRTEGRCLNCHFGSNFTDDQFHDLGLSYYGRVSIVAPLAPGKKPTTGPSPFEDFGRYKITKQPEDMGRFHTPSLRNVGRTRPYMHNGLFELEGLLAAYNAGMATLIPRGDQVNDPLFPKKDKLLRPLHLNRHDLEDLKAFLESLDEPPLRFRAKLPTES